MSAQPTKAAQSNATAPDESEKDPFQEDLAAIMSEIDQLHDEMQAPEAATGQAANSSLTPEEVAVVAEAAAITEAAMAAEAAAPTATTTSARPVLRAMTSADLGAPTASVSATGSTDSEDFMAEFRNSTGEAPLDETTTEISPAEVPFGGPLDEEATVVAKVTEIQQGSSTQDATLSMTLTGSMKLRLNYEFGEQAVTISFGEDGLQLRMADGTEFKIPTGNRAKSSKAA